MYICRNVERQNFICLSDSASKNIFKAFIDQIDYLLLDIYYFTLTSSDFYVWYLELDN